MPEWIQEIIDIVDIIDIVAFLGTLAIALTLQDGGYAFGIHIAISFATGYLRGAGWREIPTFELGWP